MDKGYEKVSMKGEAIELPLVQAELAPFDGAEEGQPPDEMEEEKASRGAFVRVVAPCDLPPNYKLQVDGSDGSTFVVTVPKQGVQKGQTFKVEKFPEAVPVEGRFSDDLCSCGGEGTYCGVAICCIGLAYAEIMEKLQLNACAGRSVSQHPSNTFKIVAFLWFAYLAIYVIQNYVTLVGDEEEQNLDTGSFLFVLTLSLVSTGLSIYLIVITIKTRMAFRSKYIIPGSCCMDCLVSCCCSCCASLQMYRHMKRSGDPPARFATFKGVEAEIV